MHKVEHRVIYGDTDAANVVYYANYFRWFESGRRELFRSLGISYKDLNEKGIVTPVVEAHCNYLYPARYDDIVIIETIIGEITEKGVKFLQKIFRKEDMKLLAEGYTVNVFVDKEKMKSMVIPEEIRKMMKLG